MTKKRARAYVYVTVKRTSSENHLGDYSIRKCGELTKKNGLEIKTNTQVIKL